MQGIVFQEIICDRHVQGNQTRCTDNRTSGNDHYQVHFGTWTPTQSNQPAAITRPHLVAIWQSASRSSHSFSQYSIQQRLETYCSPHSNEFPNKRPNNLPPPHELLTLTQRSRSTNHDFHCRTGRKADGSKHNTTMKQQQRSVGMCVSEYVSV
jgi:hypothetical protein